MQCPLARGAVTFAHELWDQILQPGDGVIDATCGNGYDTFFMAERVLTASSGSILACDIQEIALKKSQRLLLEQLDAQQYGRIQWYNGCHSVWPESCLKGSFRLIAYNLGYLPGSDQTLTTSCETTLQSIDNARPLLMCGGMISVTCYPGHAEGAREEAMLLEFTSQLDPKQWSCTYHRWLNRQKAPSLITVIRL